MMQRVYFAASRVLGRLLRSARYSSISIAKEGGHVRKHRSFYAPVLIWIGGVVVRILDTGQRVLTQREWEERERLIYQKLRGTSIEVDANGKLVLPHLAGRTLAAVLDDPTLERSSQAKAIEAAVLALAGFHRQGFTHADAMAENVLIDFEVRPGSRDRDCQAHWFDFETVHDASRSMIWRRADDLRSLMASCLVRTPPGRFEETIDLIVRAYGDEGVTRAVAAAFDSVWRRSLAYHLAQAALSFESFQEIGRLLRERTGGVHQ
jgi:hypothetical protein